MVTSSTPRKARTYGNWQRPTSAGLMGLGSLGSSILFVGLILTVFVVMAYGLLAGAGAFLLLFAFLALLLSKDKHQRSLLIRLVAWLGWNSAHSAGAHLYRSGPLGRSPWGTFQLPGLASPSRLTEHQDSYGRPFALLQVPSTGHYTVVLASDPDGATLVDVEQQDQWVAGWGHWLAQTGEEPGLEAVQVTIETAPDNGGRLRREITNRVHPDAPDLAKRMLAEAVETYPSGSSSVRAYVCLTFQATGTNGKRRSTEEMGRDLASRLPSLAAGLSATGAGAAHPLDATGLCEVIRTAYDPASAALFDEAHSEGQEVELDWSNVGPTSTQASWDSYRHDSAVSVSWTMSSAPRGNVQSGVLRRLLAPHAGIDRKRVTMHYRPLDPARAAAVVETDLRNNQFRVSAARRPAPRDVLATRQAQATADEEATGASLLNFSMVVTASVIGGPEKLPDVRAALDSLSATARLRLRPAEGNQDAAFAAGLPLGLVLPKHLHLPSDLRERL